MFLLTANSPSAQRIYVDDVFSTYLYTGNGSTQTITNGIDLAGKGGLVWIKGRNSAAPEYNWVADTGRGTGKIIRTDSTNAQVTSASSITAFNSNGFSIGAETGINTSAAINYASWTFRKAPKFFDVVTYTGNGVSGRSITHNLGQTPGMVIIKCTSNAVDWCVYHRSVGATKFLYLNSTVAAITSSTRFADTEPTSSTFTVGNDSDTNGNTLTYVAYLFAHNTGTDGIIQCGSFTTDGSGNATVNLGWEIQYAKLKASSTTENWIIVDSMRGMPVGDNDQRLYPNLSNAETAGATLSPTAVGFDATGLTASQTYIYLAIRRPNKPPTSGTSVFSSTPFTGNGAARSLTGVGFSPDVVMLQGRNTNGVWPNVNDRLRGATKQLRYSTTEVEYTITQGVTSFDMDGISVGTDGDTNQNTTTMSMWNFRRAPGVFDVVCYAGTGANQSVSHNLGVAPELIIIKSRDAAQDWPVFVSGHNTERIFLNLTLGFSSGTAYWQSSNPTSSVFYVGTDNDVSYNTKKFVAYLFATKVGVSKVGSYTGNGTSQTINCGFSAGARFVLIKRTDSTGDWYVWDTARGIVSGNDPHLSLNTTAAEVTTDDSIDPDTSGFIVNQVAATNINVDTATYIFLAFA